MTTQDGVGDAVRKLGLCCIERERCQPYAAISSVLGGDSRDSFELAGARFWGGEW